MKRSITATVWVVTLAACGGNVKENTCHQDWHDAGEKAALAGRSVREFHDYKAQCSELGEQAKRAWLDGWTRGVMAYCTFDQGFKAGSENRDHDPICPAEIRAAFARGHKAGRRVYEERMHRMEKEQERMQSDALRSSYHDDISNREKPWGSR